MCGNCYVVTQYTIPQGLHLNLEAKLSNATTQRKEFSTKHSMTYLFCKHNDKHNSFRGDMSSGTIFYRLLGVSWDCAQPITGQVTRATWPVIGRAYPELTLNKRQKTGPGIILHCRVSVLQIQLATSNYTPGMRTMSTACLVPSSNKSIPAPVIIKIKGAMMRRLRAKREFSIELLITVLANQISFILHTMQSAKYTLTTKHNNCES